MRRRPASIADFITKPRHRIHPNFQANAGFKRYYFKALSIDSKGKVNEKLGKEQALKFETEFGQYKLKRGPYANDNYWSLGASVKPPHMWWFDYGSGLLGKIGQRVTSKPCGSGAAERNWKLYKGIVTKKRNRMGELKVDTYADDAEDEMEIDQTTGTKLAFVSANLHCKKFDDYMSQPAKERVKFDATDMAFLEQLCSDAFKDDDTEKVDFNNWLEEWESSKLVKKKKEELEVRLRQKYIGIRLHDQEDADSDDDDDEGLDEVRQIVGIEFQSRKPMNVQGKWKKGYKLVTALVMDGGKLDESQKALLPYEINEVAHELITDEVNPKHTLLQKPAVSDGNE